MNLRVEFVPQGLRLGRIFIFAFIAVVAPLLLPQAAHKLSVAFKAPLQTPRAP